MGHSLDEIGDVSNKRVIVRAPLNVPVEHGEVRDTYRLEACVPTILFLTARGAKVILLGHIGRAGESLAPVAQALSVRVPLRFIDAPLTSPAVLAAIAAMQPGEVVMLQNVRSDEREETSGAVYADLLASFGDIYVNDAFADSHRAHASVVGIAERLPSYFGRSFEREMTKLEQARNPKQPSLCIIGGAKFDTKSSLIAEFAKRYTHVFVAGALMNDIYKARGYEVGTSVVSDQTPDPKVLACENLVVPIDVTVRNAMGITRVTHPSEVRFDDMIVDIGPESLAALQVSIKSAKTILWNGPLGYYEGGFDFFTKRCAEYIAQSDADTIVGGGDTIAAIRATDTMERFSHVSTAGGAMLTYLETGTLPGIDAILKENVK